MTYIFKNKPRESHEKTLLTTTALAALTGAATAEITVTRGTEATTRVPIFGGATLADLAFDDLVKAVDTNLNKSSDGMLAAGMLNTIKVILPKTAELDAPITILTDQIT